MPATYIIISRQSVYTTTTTLYAEIRGPTCSYTTQADDGNYLQIRKVRQKLAVN
jgi:hypothetical protein